MKLDKYLKGLFELLSIPSVSTQSSHKKDITKASMWLQKKFKELGLKSKILPTGGHPVVYAELTGNKIFPTILVYGHYDVQSPDPLTEWASNPFKPEVRGGNIYGRGVADDKGQLYTWIAALEEIQKEKYKLKVNLKFLIEGEEEVGSKNLGLFIIKNKSLLKSNICVLSDTHCLSEEQPMIDYGLRGIVYTEIKVRTLAKDVHSGLYGGNVLNPIQVLSQIIGGLKDKNHNILIPKFYGKVRKVSFFERKRLKKLPFTEKDILKETGAKVVAGEKGLGVHERAGARPTLEINGILGGYIQEGVKTIIPQEVTAKISMRIVPNQNSEEIFSLFKNYVYTLSPKGADITIELLSTAEPMMVDTKSKYFKSAENAYQKVFGKKPLYELSGGTIGVVADFKNTLGIDSIMMGYGLPDDGLHSPNEKFSLSMFEKGIKTNMEFLKSLS